MDLYFYLAGSLDLSLSDFTIGLVDYAFLFFRRGGTCFLLLLNWSSFCPSFSSFLIIFPFFLSSSIFSDIFFNSFFIFLNSFFIASIASVDGFSSSLICYFTFSDMPYSSASSYFSSCYPPSFLFYRKLVNYSSFAFSYNLIKCSTVSLYEDSMPIIFESPWLLISWQFINVKLFILLQTERRCYLKQLKLSKAVKACRISGSGKL